MSDLTFVWHDYETFGKVPRHDRPAQFAAVRTDADLNEIGTPLMQYCRPAPDYLPDPQACLLTGIVPQTCQRLGVAEREFARSIESELALPGTVGVGYNSIGFDDEVTRHLFWRNLIDPYAREWRNDCARWDLLHVARCAWALRPHGIEWPVDATGRASFKLTALTAANAVAHASAHDALADVRATLALARILKSRKPALWDFCLRLRHKAQVLGELESARARGQPFLHVSGVYGVERGCMALAWPVGAHPTNKNEVVVWDLASDPEQLLQLTAPQIRERLFVSRAELAPGAARLPLRTLAVNKCPVVVGNLKVLSPEVAQRWGVDLDQAQRHARALAAHADHLTSLWAAVYERPERDGAPDVDEDLYGGFVGPEDRRVLERLRGLDGPALAAQRPAFADARLEELVFRYRARNFPGSLDPHDQDRWLEHRRRRLLGGQGGGPTLQAYQQTLETLGEDADERTQEILGALFDYATDIAPDRD